MKPAQWIGAVLAGAAMVFVITFALNYLGGSSQPPQEDPNKPPELQLTFPVTQAPSGPTDAFSSECQKVSWHDFWFHNENDKPVKVGLLRKTCKCTNVELYLLPDDWEQRVPPGWSPESAAALAAEAAAGPLHLGMVPAVKSDQLREAFAPARLAPQLHPKALEQEEVGEVPPGGRGWVRVKWVGEHPGPQQLAATLWSDNKDGPTTILAVRTIHHMPVQATTTVTAATRTTRELEKAGSVPLSIYCWSVTRPSFHVQAQREGAQTSAASDPFEVGAPVPLTLDERKWVAKQEKEQEGSVRCGYRVPVRLRAVSADGTTPFELGVFHRYVKLSFDEGVEPILVQVNGKVVGEVTASDDEGRIVLGNFRHSEGTPWRSIALESDTPGMELQVDGERVPKYLEVRLDKPTEAKSGHRTWHLKVRVKPNMARGPFPRREDPAYADGAVYVKMVGRTGRAIRIPVSGVANDG